MSKFFNQRQNTSRVGFSPHVTTSIVTPDPVVTFVLSQVSQDVKSIQLTQIGILTQVSQDVKSIQLTQIGILTQVEMDT